MRKYLSLLLALLLSLSPTAISATDDYNEVTSDGDQTIELYALVTSSYTVKLPKSVDVSTSGTTFTIEVKGDIAADEQISISFDDCSLSETSVKTGDDAHEDIELTVSADVETFTFDLIEADTYAETGKATVTVTHDTIPAGDWSADLSVTISLNDIQ